jgi:hypothetical protein
MLPVEKTNKPSTQIHADERGFNRSASPTLILSALICVNLRQKVFALMLTALLTLPAAIDLTAATFVQLFVLEQLL